MVNKKDKVMGKKILFGKKTYIFIAMLAVAGALYIFESKIDAGALQNGGSYHKNVKAVNGKINIPLSDLNDDKAKYFRYKFSDTTVDFFVVRSSDGVLRAAFDSCDVCFREKKGYTQNGDLMVCNNCGQTFPTNRINIEKGGCNPAPLDRKVVGEKLVIDIVDLYAGKKYFL
jgi:uncharacterized membrane protein